MTVQMKPHVFKIIVALSMGITATAAILGLIALVITGFYPAIIPLSLIPFIPIGSERYAKRTVGESSDFQRTYYTTFAMLNLLAILVVLWLSFVITIERIIPNL